MSIPNSEESVRLTETLGELKRNSLEAFASAQKKIQLYTHNLDPRILNNREFEKQCLRLVRLSRYARIEILIKDETCLNGIDHRLVNIAQRYTSYMGIKVIPKDFHENLFAFYLIDGRTLIYRRVADRFEAEIHQVPSSQLKRRSKYFDEVWQQASPASHLRALNL
jgi:hypothetical protein